MAPEMDESLRIYLEESGEHLEDLEHQLLIIEENGADIDDEVVNRVFRAAHSIKGGAGFFHLTNIQQLSHKIESVLDQVRGRILVPNSEMINILLTSFDKLRELLNDPVAGKDVEIDEFIFSLDNLLNMENGSLEVEPDEEVIRADVPGINIEDIAPAPVETSVKKESLPGSSVRVKLMLLEQLIILAGELVLSRNALGDAISRGEKKFIKSAGQRINQVTSELQEVIMQTRMQPVNTIFNKFPRMVRDMSRGLGKEIRLDISGEDVELDKTILEGLNESLTHLIRNAIDHGIEKPGERLKNGKPAQGIIRLEAFYQGGQAVIKIIDDGKGIDPDKIINNAVSKRIVNRESVSLMSPEEKTALIFHPGLSTAEKVTSLSGRGVGMDVVKSNIDQLGGIVDISSVSGKGTTFAIQLPLTLAIIPSLLISVSEERFAIPRINVEELIRIPAADVKRRIEIIGDTNILNLRGDLIPLAYLADVLGVTRTYVDPVTGIRNVDKRKKYIERRGGTDEEIETGKAARKRIGTDRRIMADSDLNIVIVSTGNYHYGLIVEKLHDNLDIVVKPIGYHLKECKEYAGATILGDGRVSLILDIAGIGNLLNIRTLKGRLPSRETKQKRSLEVPDRNHSYLYFKYTAADQFALPLEAVERVEYFSGSVIEQVSGKFIIQYRGAALPLVKLEDVLGCPPPDQEQKSAVIIIRSADHQLGIPARQPVDSVEIAGGIDPGTFRKKGVAGSVIIKGITTLVLNLHEIVEISFPGWIENHAPVNLPGDENSFILVVEDSAFFRSEMLKSIEAEGYLTLAAEDGEVAWALLEKYGENIKLMVTDIEMPNLDGLGLTVRIRKDKRFNNLPIIAVTALAGEEDIQKGKEAGITEYLVKMDKKALAASIKAHLKTAVVH